MSFKLRYEEGAQFTGISVWKITVGKKRKQISEMISRNWTLFFNLSVADTIEIYYIYGWIVCQLYNCIISTMRPISFVSKHRVTWKFHRILFSLLSYTSEIFSSLLHSHLELYLLKVKKNENWLHVPTNKKKFPIKKNLCSHFVRCS